MIVAAIFLIVIGVVALFLSARPRLAFFLDEGWKFRNKTEQSRTYEAVSFTKFLVLGVAAVVGGLVLLAMNATFSRQDAARAAFDRCQSEFLPQFTRTIRWDGGELGNEDEVRSLANRLGVKVVFATGEVIVLDPKRHGDDKEVLRFLAANHDQSWAGPFRCNDYDK
ncbi:hypothetical protein [Mycobacterium sp. EPa45]|uniref:hypothetical protein n=1 Tax=Mycobacterium sp. EPa45 TaxID=1545728 RepID=UPI0006421635|nr:hypothetical protein [Mycobacterium sp. EPa45]AKK28542.1 hypothetical protein AB431_19800 [Mycobacterium sp. EPa45]